MPNGTEHSSCTDPGSQAAMALIELAFLVALLRAQRLSATCMEHGDHIQRYLICYSLEPPYADYYNISKRVGKGIFREP